MTDYTDIPQANILYAEVEKCGQALKMIDDETGTMTHFTVSPLPLPPGTMPTTMMMSVQIALPSPAQASTMAEIRTQVVAYQQSLLDQLAALGITSAPAKAADL